ncbi:MAG: flagellar hook-associated protein FlgK [Desulfobacterales bacterium]|nr:MAG: flagellar hook-associated protein FlgK [Desulfobacterales bacterium]
MENITGRIFDLGRTALLTQQQGINITGHNIANVNTKGYSRQVLVLETNQPIDTICGQVGAGVGAKTVERVYALFLSRQINEASTNQGAWEASRQILEQVEFVFNESTGFGLNESMENFWNAWQDLSNNPSGLTEREVLLVKADTMARDFQGAHEYLERLQGDTQNLINDTVERINQLAREITNLNDKINRIEAGNQNANDLQDRRDVKIRELAELVDIDTIQGDGGLLYVHAAGHPLVIGLSSPETMTLEDVKDSVAGGRLKGCLDGYGEVESCKEDLRLLACSIRDQVNAVHEDGYDLYGQSADPVVNASARSFFLDDAEVMEIGITDYNRVAAAASPDSPGDNTNANNIYALRDQSMGPAVSGISIVGTGKLAVDFTDFMLKWDNAALEWHIMRGDLANGDPYDVKVAAPIDQPDFFRINFDVDGDGLEDKSIEVSLAAPMSYDVVMAFDIMGGDFVYKQNQPPHDFYNSLVARIGSGVEEAGRNKSHSAQMLEQLDNYRESISGVSMNEEIINLVQYQNAYQAAAKIITTVDEMIDTLMDMI